MLVPNETIEYMRKTPLLTNLEVEDDSPAETQHYTRFSVHHIRGVDVNQFYFTSIENL